MAYLVVTMNGKELYRRELSGPVTLGRSTDCDLWINDAGVSRRHCRIERNGDAWEVQDLGSRNGIVLHGERVTKHALTDGDAVHIGSARIAFHAVGYVSSRPATPQPSGDSISDTVISNSASRLGRALPTPRAAMPTPHAAIPKVPSRAEVDAAQPVAPLAFTRPPARPIPTVKADPDNADRHESLLRRLLHK